MVFYMASVLLETVQKTMEDLNTRYKKGAILYPNLMRREYKVGIEEMFQVFLILESKKIVHRRYVMVCSKCHSYVLESPKRNQIPNTTTCTVCGKTITTDESLQMNFVKIV